jgi:ELWxxDGT repeat protein
MVSSADGSAPEALWLSDGTGPGTQLVHRWGPDGASLEARMPGQLLAVGTRVFLAAGDVTHGRELWVSDGTKAGTRRVADIQEGADGSAPRDLVPFGGGVLFTATGADGRGLWRSDGTPEGTRRVTSGACEAGEPLGPRDLRRVGSRIFFVAVSGAWTDEGCVETGGPDLWVTDGTTDGTRRVRPEGITNGIAPRHLVAVGGRAWFSADDGVHGREPWVSDGTPEGTTMVADLRADGSSDPAGLTRVGDALWFSADDGRHGREPWIVRP